MQTTWPLIILPALLAATLVLGPGFLMVRAAGGRAAAAIGLAPVVSTSLVVVASTFLWVVKLPWNLLGFAAFVGVACSAAFVLRRLVERRWPVAAPPATAPNPLGTIAIAVGVAAIILGAELIYVFGSPDWISQTTDGVFHLNSVRYMVDSGDGSIFSASLGLNGGPPSAYPAAWHSFAALIATASGASIPESVIALNLIIGALVWPLGAVFFVRQLFGNGRRYILGTGLLITCFGTFPFRLLDWGVLYPNLLSTALVLPVAGLVVILLRRTRSGDCCHPGMVAALLLIAVPGMFFSHPSGVLLVLGLVLPMIIGSWLKQSRLFPLQGGLRGLGWRQVVAPLSVTVILLAWLTLRPQPLSAIQFNPPYQNPQQAIGEALWVTHSWNLPSFAVAPLVIIGAVAVWRKNTQRWFVASYLLFGLLFVAVAGFPPSELRSFLTGVWYDDYNRLAAGFVLVALPMSVSGATALAETINRRIPELKRTPRKRAANLIIALLTVVVLGVSFAVSTQPAIDSAKRNFAITPTSAMMSSDELELYKKLGDFVGPSEFVVGDPWNGSGLAYLYSGTNMTFNQIFTAMTPEKDLVARSLRWVSKRPEVCDAVRSLNIHYVLQSTQQPFQHGYPKDAQYDGLFNIDHAKGFSLVTAVGTASLYRITACWS